MGVLLQFLLGQSAFPTVAAIMSASQTVAISQDGAGALDDDVALLQEKMSIKKQDPEDGGSAEGEEAEEREEADENDEGDEDDDREESGESEESEEPDYEWDLIDNVPMAIWEFGDFDVGSYLSEDYLQCVEGPWAQIGVQLGVGRATPWSLLYNSHPRVGETCAGRGYSELLLQEDECFPSSSRWTRPGSPPERTQAGIPSGGLWAAAFDAYDNRNNYPVGSARNWVACGLCEEGSAIKSGAAWDVDCAGYPANLLAGMRSPDIPNGFRSIVPVGGNVCIEGQTDYLERVVANARTTPLGAVFEGSEFSTEDCTARGYDIVRDMQNECWPLSRTHMMSEHEDVHMSNWIGRYWTAILDHDSTAESGGLWSNLDWVSCKACESGGAVRDRGMYVTQDGGNSVPYTEAYCNAMDFPTLSN